MLHHVSNIKLHTESQSSKNKYALTCAEVDGFALGPSGIIDDILGIALRLALTTLEGFVVGCTEVDGLTVVS